MASKPDVVKPLNGSSGDSMRPPAQQGIKIGGGDMIEAIGGVINLWRPKQPNPFRERVESHQIVKCPLCEQMVRAQNEGHNGWRCPWCAGKILTEG